MKKIVMLILLCGTMLHGAWGKWYAKKVNDKFGDPKNVVAMVENGSTNFIGIAYSGDHIGMFCGFGRSNMGYATTTIEVKIDNNDPIELESIADGPAIVTARTPANAENWDLMIEQMKAGKRIRIAAEDDNWENKLIDAPLIGFTAAYNQLK